MVDIRFNPELFDIVHNFSKITNTLVFRKSPDNKKVLLWMRNAASSFAFTIDAPVEYFDFPTKTFPIYNYADFYKYFNNLNVMKMQMDESHICMISNNSKLEYLLTTAAVLDPKTVLKEINFGNVDFQFGLSKEDLDDISKMNSLLTAKVARMFGNKDAVTIQIYMDKRSNLYEKNINITNLSNFTKDFDFSIFAQTFTMLPSKQNYIIDVNCEGFVKFHFEKSNIDVNIYVGKMI